MTRQQREEELNRLLKSEDGMNEIVRLYRSECPDGAPGEPDPPHGMMVRLILDREFPTVLPGGEPFQRVSK
jgi:hypothetical protein